MKMKKNKEAEKLMNIVSESFASESKVKYLGEEVAFYSDDLGVPNKWNPGKEGETITGKFQGVRTISPEGYDPWESVFISDNGVIYTVGGAYLTKLMKTYPENILVRITYLGEHRMEKGKNPMKNFSVQVNEDDRLKVEKYRKVLSESDPDSDSAEAHRRLKEDDRNAIGEDLPF